MTHVARRHGLITEGMERVLRYLFSDEFPFRVLLGGSCALSEFHLGHRIPRDVDVFLADRSQAQNAASHLADHFGGAAIADPERSHTHIVNVDIGAECVETHCAVLHQRWQDFEMSVRYIIECDQVRLVTLPYLSFEKLRSLQSEHHDQSKRAISLYDMKCMLNSTLTMDHVVSEVLWLASRARVSWQLPGISINSVLRDLPRMAYVDGSNKDLSSFAEEFSRTLREGWRSSGLEALLADVG